MSMFGEIDPEEWGYVLVKRRSASSKRVGGFDTALAAADAARRELGRSTAFDDFRVVVIPPGGDLSSL